MGSTSSSGTRTRRPARTFAGGAAAVAIAAVTTLGSPAVSNAQLPPPAPPEITATVDGNDVALNLKDPNRGLEHALTFCTAAILDVAKAVPLLPGLVTGELPPLDQIDPAVFAWGPALDPTNALARERNWQVTDLPVGFYAAVGVCINPNITKPAIDFAPVLIGSPIELGSSTLQLGSAVLDTPGALSAILTLVGVDTGSLGGSSGSAG